MPAKVRMATEEYRAGEDIVHDFINSCCIIDPQAKVLFKDLFLEFKIYCLESNEKPLTKKEFKNKLEEKSYRILNGTGNALTVYSIGRKEIDINKGRTLIV